MKPKPDKLISDQKSAGRLPYKWTQDKAIAGDNQS